MSKLISQNSLKTHHYASVFKQLTPNPPSLGVGVGKSTNAKGAMTHQASLWNTDLGLPPEPEIVYLQGKSYYNEVEVRNKTKARLWNGKI